MKEAVYKFFVSGLMIMIFLGMLHAMRLLSDLNDYNYIKRLSEKNSGFAAAGYDTPAASAKAPENVMRTEPVPIAGEELSYFYLDGIRFDFPCTIADLQEHFEMSQYLSTYNKKISKFIGMKLLLKNGVGTYRIRYIADSMDSPPEECIVTSVGGQVGYSQKYSPQLVIAGIDVYNTSDEEYLRLAGLDENEYLITENIIYPCGNGNYIVFNFFNKGLTYYESDDTFAYTYSEDLETQFPHLIKTELRLPENYDPDTVPESKEELIEFVRSFYADDDKYSPNYKSNRFIQKTLDNACFTAYEFLALTGEEFNAEYYEITELTRITKLDLTDGYNTIYTGYLKVIVKCYVEGEGRPYTIEMVLKPGDPLGNGLIIQNDVWETFYDEARIRE